MDQLILRSINTGGIRGLPLFVLVTLLSAGLLSFIVGLERELHGEPTGLATHVLISVSCSLLMTLSIFAMRIGDGNFQLTQGETNYDTSRIAASIVSGVGFLGAGAIIKDGPRVKGMSTASTLWVSSAIGMACGAGMVAEAVILTAVTMATLYISARCRKFIDSRLPWLEVAIRNQGPIIGSIMRHAGENGMVIREIYADPIEEDDSVIVVRVLFAYKTTQVMILDLARTMLREEIVIYAECATMRVS